MSAWSDWQSGAITKDDYAFEMRQEALLDEQEDCERSCGNCKYCDWGKSDKPCCYCHDYSLFEACEE